MNCEKTIKVTKSKGTINSDVSKKKTIEKINNETLIKINEILDKYDELQWLTGC